MHPCGAIFTALTHDICVTSLIRKHNQPVSYQVKILMYVSRKCRNLTYYKYLNIHRPSHWLVPGICTTNYVLCMRQIYSFAF